MTGFEVAPAGIVGTPPCGCPSAFFLRRDDPSALSESIAHLPAFAPVGPFRERARIRREGETANMGFGKRMMTKARARVRAFFAPRRSRVVNSGEKEELRKTGVVVRRRAACEPPLHVLEATRARRPRHNKDDAIFDKIRQIHGFIPQIRAFFRQIQDPSERGKNINLLKIKGLWESEGAGRGYFARPRHLRASARTRASRALRRRPANPPRGCSPGSGGRGGLRLFAKGAMMRRPFGERIFP